MKFGRTLPQYQIPEWSSSYINYKGLKKLIKAAAATAKTGRDPDLAEFFFSLDRNLEDVDEFYNKKFGDASRRLKLLEDRYGTSKQALEALDRNEIDELMGALLELRSQLRKLQWFGEVNRKGFVKITKKLDKKVPNVCTQQRYLASKVFLTPFATSTSLVAALKDLNDWLSNLGNTRNKDDAPSVHSAHSVKRVSSRSILNLPNGLLDTVDQAIRNDDVPILKETLAEVEFESSDPGMQQLFINLLQRSISCRSNKSIGYLLKDIKSLDEADDINHRNCLHRLVISIGRSKSAKMGVSTIDIVASMSSDELRYLTPAESPPLGPGRSSLKESSLLSLADESVQLLAYVLEQLEPQQRPALNSEDSYGRLPLHYAAQFGFVVICELVMKYMQDWGQFNVENGIDAPEWQDNEGLAPLHLSVIGGHPLTTQALLTGENWKGRSDNKAAMRRDISKSSAVLALATKSNFTQIVKLLVDAGVDINWQDEIGDSALHIAARFGNEDCAKTLLEGTKDQRADLELTEKTFSWTPLHVACVDGHLSIVDLLVAAGADINKPDASGWTAREHAALRGHMDIAKVLEVAAVESSSSASGSEDSGSTAASSPPVMSSMEASRSQMPTRTTEPVKTFGHRYLTNESMVLVSLGSMDMRKAVPAVKLDRIPIAEAHSTQLDTALSVIVSAKGAQGEPTIIDLPVQDNISTEPMVFTTADVSKVKLYFDIVPTYSGSDEHKVGRGVAILSTIKQAIGLKRMNLQGDVSVPIMSTDLEVIGVVNFNFLVITPFSHPNMGISTEHTYWRKMTSTMLIGHRGLGKNATSNKSLQLGENTLQSFIAAANLGANYVEFDVQLTKDHVPVIYHDFLVSETGIDAPVHTLTLEQFLHVNDSTPRASRPPSPPRDPKLNVVRGMDRQRSLSLGHELPDYDMAERMKHTRDFKAKGFKANSRGNFIQAPFTTLEEMFLKIPENVGFNIEMKYPMLHETEEQEMDSTAVELNNFVDTVLTKVYELGKERKIIFSSFNPDICLLLSFKQPSIPVLFLTDGGICPVGDIRASSLQEAIRFASRWNLLGIVSSAEPFCNSPRLVRVVKENGLVCVSYGSLNNNPEKVQQQVQEGIDAVIVDSVLKIRNGLTKNAKATAASMEASQQVNGVNGVNETAVV
ncbi:GDPD-domain-containing protein [Hyaloscypha bicolor E]|uniref:GDPD-domain-containing protein n=1 Tax=Hyaloscypha bicolor E TaxID=1095630 RepID=A0A2J6SUV1_9HELO|nr:GDPD-domain-containing protein [Hyaloscypha bicolor E]PMD54546.1 GDPD-domain-containing protein [Hyaloscypha bicolor E]